VLEGGTRAYVHLPPSAALKALADSRRRGYEHLRLGGRSFRLARILAVEHGGRRTELPPAEDPRLEDAQR
jgi:hypothetical protein